ncbi:MAG: glycine cleavage system aminomethyltransferase GcvT [Acidobacteriota bacterium]
MKETPLNRAHKALGARMVEFAGWEMPVQYESALQEHIAVRNAVGLFDVSHMGRLRIKGRDALALVQQVSCNDAARLADGQAQYSGLLNTAGGFIDDIIVHRFASDQFMICVNASGREKDLAWFLNHQSGNVEIIDESDVTAQIAVQGPKAVEILQPLTKIPLQEIKYYWFREGDVGGTKALIARTGYTGEDGFELYLPASAAELIWNRLLDAGQAAGVRPAGLAARNTLRLEMKMPLYGNDIDDTTTPWEAGLGWIVKLSKGDFVGKSALERQQQEGVRRKLVGFELIDRGIARDHFPVWIEDRPAGHVTSGSYSPSLEKSIGLAYLPVDHEAFGSRFSVEVRRKRLAAQVVQTPFYRRK